jgi:hypothetical protein
MEGWKVQIGKSITMQEIEWNNRKLVDINESKKNSLPKERQ